MISLFSHLGMDILSHNKLPTISSQLDTIKNMENQCLLRPSIFETVVQLSTSTLP